LLTAESARMPTHQVPILLLQDSEGFWTARLVEPESPLVGTGETPADALAQIKMYLDWSYQRDPYKTVPDFQKPRLTRLKVTVRPHYPEPDRVYPSAETMELPVDCVLGQRSDGVLACVAPLISVRFDYNEANALEPLLHDAVLSQLAGKTPRQLSRFFPPVALEVRELTIRIKPRLWQEQRTMYLPALEESADPLGDGTIRKRYSRAWLREAELLDLKARLLEERANVLLIGERGVGKTTLLVDAVRETERQIQLAAKSSEDPGTHRPYRRRFWMTSAARIIAGMQYLGEWEARLEEILFELSEIQGVLCVENLLDLLRVGGSEVSQSIAAFLMPYLQQGELRLVAEATPEELSAAERLLPGFADLFQKQRVEALSRRQMAEVLEKTLESARQKHPRPNDWQIADQVPEVLLHLHQRFLPYHSFPGPVVQFLRDLIQPALRETPPRIDHARLYEAFAKRTGVAVKFLREDLPLDADHVFLELSKQVIGQDQAVRSVVDLIATFKAGLNNPNRPLGVLLFCGPTGVGKTELAKILAKFCFGEGDDPDRLFRLDMSEYQGYGSSERFIMQPDRAPSRLISHIREKPFSVLLLDEIEKADVEVFDLLLNLFEEGRLTDAYGRTTHFQSAIIIMTSNLGADAATPLGYKPQTSPRYEQVAMQFFRPEFYNRIDEVLSFAALSEEAMRLITAKELLAISEREGLAERQVSLVYAEKFVKEVAKRGFDARYGARPLKRFLETEVVTPIAEYLVKHPAIQKAALRLEFGEAGNVIVSPAAL
jgi:ATP-dependent Clp protease ATP-binding subunit ClpC